MDKADVALTQWINAFAGVSSGLDRVMIYVTIWGFYLLILLVALQWWAPHDRMRARHAAVVAGLAFLLGLAVNQVLLLFIHRGRPYDAGLTNLIIDKSADFAFPSDHATAVSAIAAAFLLSNLPGRGLLFLLGAFLVCVSRVYVGTHYVSDVLGGAAIGALAAWLVHLVYREGSRADRVITGIL